ncbi:LETM1 domain-containing protein 1 [Nomia melanderi]|uniref:LETM1 domain-containing protein 1 n=1 Tax=Nomia melanderi TaxID=2448451 RepID=UPI00130464AC|nr:LETM1 domain-containing protein 1 [Nomia melanderi]
MYKLLCQRFIYRNKSTFSSTYIRIQYKSETKQKLEKSRVSNVKTYWFNRYINYIKNYDRVLEKNFPQTMQIYKVFATGTKDFMGEVIKYVTTIQKPSTSLTTKELQLTYTMRRDLIKMCPVLLISAVPFTNYVLFPLIYYFPRYFLTSHYWTPQQKLDFMVLDHKKRLKHNRPLFRCMQTELLNIKNKSLKAKWNSIIACLGSGTHPHVEDIITCSELFAGQPYAIDNLKRKHIKELLAIHGIPTWRPFRKQKLIERGMFIKQMDESIQREGGVTILSEDAICWALSFRGLNPANMSIENMQKWLTQWFIVSNNVNENTISLLLHCPILLAYNHPTNWILIYS